MLITGGFSPFYSRNQYKMQVIDIRGYWKAAKQVSPFQLIIDHLVCIHRCFTKAFHKVLTFLYFDHLKVLFANTP